MTPREQLADINGWRAQGFNDDRIKEMHDEGRKYPAKVHELTKARVQQWMSDRAFQDRLFSGDPEAKGQVAAAATILSGAVAA